MVKTYVGARFIAPRKFERPLFGKAKELGQMAAKPAETNIPLQLKQRRGGLEGVVAAITALSKAEGTTGRLLYRGYNISDLVHTTTFEEVAYLLWFGHLPTTSELAALKADLFREYTLPPLVVQFLRELPPTADPMDVLRTAISLWGAMTVKGKPNIDQAIAVAARFPILLAAFSRLRNGLEPLEARRELGHAANYLYLLSGQKPGNEQIQALNRYFVLLADHGMNASTFTARVVASTESDIVSAVVAAIGSLKGPLHGGAPTAVLDMLEAISTPERAEGWIRETLGRHERIIGFGHRVYRTADPRAEELRKLCRLVKAQHFPLAQRVEEVALELLKKEKPGRPLSTNVDYYSVVFLDALGLPSDLFTPTLAISRVVGWTAHILEQVGNNRLIRPDAEYIGPTDLRFVPLDERKT